MLRFRAVVALVLVLLSSAAWAGEVGWSTLLVARFGNIDAIDAEDGELARFVKNIRNDGRFIPPMRALVGPEIRNPTFFGVTFEGWIECALLAPTTPGRTSTVWVFPIDNRDEYLAQLASQGLTEYEGMDGVTILREMDGDGNIRVWHLQWLPGNVAVFGADREAVMACRRIYADQSAARGLLFSSGGRYVNPDITVRFDLPTMAGWQAGEAGVYWWRETIDRLTRDLLDFWQPGSARQRLVWSMADVLAMWPRSVSRFDISFWLEPEGIEWRIETEGEYGIPRTGQLNLLRSVPDRTAVASAWPVTPASSAEQAAWIGDFLLSAAGGVVTREAREVGRAFYDLVANGGLREVVTALVPPPAGYPNLGGARLFMMDWAFPERADRVWAELKRILGADPTIANVFAQMGVRIVVEETPGDSSTVGVSVYPVTDPEAAPYYHASWSYRRSGSVAALVTGMDRADAADRVRVREYRGNLAEAAAGHVGEGGADVRAAFTRVGEGGASWIGFLEPVRFLQFCLVESGDWRPRSPDQNEPVSTQLAREMLEYGSGRAWTAAGEARRNSWRIDGGVTWDSLSRLAAALGITEAIGM